MCDIFICNFWTFLVAFATSVFGYIGGFLILVGVLDFYGCYRKGVSQDIYGSSMLLGGFGIILGLPFAFWAALNIVILVGLITALVSYYPG